MRRNWSVETWLRNVFITSILLLTLSTHIQTLLSLHLLLVLWLFAHSLTNCFPVQMCGKLEKTSHFCSHWVVPVISVSIPIFLMRNTLFFLPFCVQETFQLFVLAANMECDTGLRVRITIDPQKEERNLCLRLLSLLIERECVKGGEKNYDCSFSWWGRSIESVFDESFPSFRIASGVVVVLVPGHKCNSMMTRMMDEPTGEWTD